MQIIIQLKELLISDDVIRAGIYNIFVLFFYMIQRNYERKIFEFISFHTQKQIETSSFNSLYRNYILIRIRNIFFRVLLRNLVQIQKLLLYRYLQLAILYSQTSVYSHPFIKMQWFIMPGDIGNKYFYPAYRITLAYKVIFAVCVALGGRRGVRYI